MTLILKEKSYVEFGLFFDGRIQIQIFRRVESGSRSFFEGRKRARIRVSCIRIRNHVYTYDDYNDEKVMEGGDVIVRTPSPLKAQFAYPTRIY